MIDLRDREEPLRTLAQLAASSRAGDGRIGLVVGDAGIGKTTLVRTFLEQLGDDFRVLKGFCEDLTVPEPLAPVRELLGGADLQVRGEGHSRNEMHSHYSSILEAMVGDAEQTIVVIEDLHWADSATVEFVRFAARRVLDRPLLFLVTARDNEAAGRQVIRRAFGDLSTDILVRIPLGPLSEASVAFLCETTGMDAADVYRLSGGNSFYVAELLKGSGNTLPPSVQEAVLRRADILDLSGRMTLEAVSIFPRRAEIEHVASMIGPNADEGVDACIDHGLLNSDGAGLFFSHELARRAVLENLRPHRKRSLHASAYEHLAASGEQVIPRLLHHASEAGKKDVVARLAPKAARQAANSGSWREAAAFFALAVDQSADQPDTDLFQEAAWAMYLTGNHGKASHYQIEAQNILETGDDRVAIGDGQRKLARYLYFRGEYSAALQSSQNAIDTLAAHPGPELALAYSALSQLHMAAYRFDEVESPAQNALDLAGQYDRPDIRAHALNNLAVAHTHSDTEKAQSELSESLELALALGDPDHAARAYINWMHLEYDVCHFDRALERAQDAWAYTKDHELDGYGFYALGMIARANHRLGLWDRVAPFARKAFDREEPLPNPHIFNGAIALYAHLVRRGDPVDPELENYLSRFDNADTEVQRLAPYAELAAERSWLNSEQSDAAVARLLRLAKVAATPETIGSTFLWLSRFGIDHALPNLSDFPLPYRLEISGDRLGAAGAWRACNAPYDEAMALAFGTTADKRRAVEIFERLGARPALERVREELGIGPDRRDQKAPSLHQNKTPFGLSRRQLDVLSLLTEGLTNNEIGARLFISPKTVDHHVSAILAKLEAPNRGAAAAIARREGLQK